MGEIYDSAFERIASQHEDDFALARQVLSWACLSYEPLSIPQLQHAIAIETGVPEEDPDSLFPSDYLISVCAGLITCDNLRSTVRFIHYTAADYFSRSKNTHFPRAEIQLVHTCLLQLTNFMAPNYNLHVDYMQIKKEELLDRFPFLIYAARYLVAHARYQFQQVPDEGLAKTIRELWLDSEKRLSLKAISLSRLSYYDSIQLCLLDVYPALNELEFATFFGLEAWVDKILTLSPDEGQVLAVEPPPKGSLCASLCIAAFYGFDNILQMILKNAGSDDLRGSITVRPRQSKSNDEPLMLQPHHRELNPGEENPFWTVIECAIARNKLSTLKIILSSLDELTQLWPGEHNPLFFPQSLESDKILACLLKYGFKDENPKGETLLHLVCKEHDKRLVAFLLDHGANVDATTSSQQTPLHYAVRYDNRGEDLHLIIELLLKHKADINAHTKFHTTALMHAKEMGDLQLVKLLESHGARESQPQYLKPKVMEYMTEEELNQWVKLLEEGSLDTSSLESLTPLTRKCFPKNSSIIQIAYLNDNIPYMELLIAAGFDASRCGPDGSALHDACICFFHTDLEV